MIVPSTRIHDLLQDHPELFEVLVQASPAFDKLRNPLLRRVMPRLVTVAQAAGMGGLEVSDLLQQLNKALGQRAPAFPSTNRPASTLRNPPPPWLVLQAAAELDVRPLLEQGKEPFQAVMWVARELEVGQRFVLLAPFEPIPLYEALGKLGFVGWCEQQEGVYHTHFHRQSHQAVARGPAVQVDGGEPDLDLAFDFEIHIPETLEPPEPMVRVLQALEALQPGQRLLVHHVRRPIYLLEKLQELGHRVQVEELGPGQVEVLVQRGSR